jgi:protoheme IX farnesyltransferase
LPTLVKSALAIDEGFLADLFSLTKPKITLMTLLVAIAGGMIANVGDSLNLWRFIPALLGIGLLISGASALNMYYERYEDQKMQRTRNRALAAGRLPAAWGIWVGAGASLLSLPLLYWAGNGLTLLCAIFSLVLYVWCYTPLKQKSWIALWVGSIPGAMPVVLGYVAVSNALDMKVVALFAWAFLWQVPHFLAISVFRESEYTRAGFVVMPAVYGVKVTKHAILWTSWLLFLASFGLYMSGVFSLLLLGLALSIGVWYLFTAHRGFYKLDDNDWAKRTFKATLYYQSLLFFLLVGSAL